MATLTAQTTLVPETSSSSLIGASPPPGQKPPIKRLVLFFDGTGNSFSGSNADTNVIKMLNKLARSDSNQLHYYQTGIGTYDVRNEGSVDNNWLVQRWSSLLQTMDQGFGTTFASHLMAGYRFLMRYYNAGDKIYMFGFSRGAFIARFLARMLNTVGLLCKGNEEMVRFAYTLYRRHLQDETRTISDEVEAFSRTFCRRETIPGGRAGTETNVRVFFLGIWDCVNSVAVLERNAPAAATVSGTAHHVRHAVAVDERRVKFRPALLSQDKLRSLFRTRKPVKSSAHAREDKFQMSDVPLAWMMSEIEAVGEMVPEAALRFGPSACGFHRRYKERREQTRTSVLHDSLRFGHGTGFFRVLLWRFLEYMPFISRRELIRDKWVNKRFRPNWGSARDIPLDAVMHESLVERLQMNRHYHPLNNHGDDLDPCLKFDGRATEFKLERSDRPEHKTYVFAKLLNGTNGTNGTNGVNGSNGVNTNGTNGHGMMA
ncbi:sporulation associated protein [Ophiocordyceps camponoti-floridani]|uniref:Sporulation associated protein n=1 Tax=Ophiocordyceps camponoti-floridani TaxID=2030778 RepID=A0A8H4VBW8_9HYPO|nr:sporulation associated protein [Ophiocordyceps camponoti-floridani]